MNTDNNILPTGTVLKGKQLTYRIEKVLGNGGFGITYLATTVMQIGNVPVKALFAIKEHFLKNDCERAENSTEVKYSLPARERVENSRKDFMAEARRLQTFGVNHNNIVKVNEVFEANNTAYYVMEYLEGNTLRAYVESRNKLTETETMAVMEPIVDAVRELHRNHMTHLDIKPDNIMIDIDAEGNIRPVLIDFGLSKHYDAEGNATSTINLLGCSDGYAPVEQYAGITTFSPEADYYAIGATLFYCLAGKRPPRSSDLIGKQLGDMLPSDVSVEMCRIINDATATDKACRNLQMPIPSSMQENEITVTLRRQETGSPQTSFSSFSKDFVSKSNINIEISEESDSFRYSLFNPNFFDRRLLSIFAWIFAICALGLLTQRTINIISTIPLALACIGVVFLSVKGINYPEKFAVKRKYGYWYAFFIAFAITSSCAAVGFDRNEAIESLLPASVAYVIIMSTYELMRRFKPKLLQIFFSLIALIFIFGGIFIICTVF